MATPATPLSFSDVLRLRPVRRLWIAQIVSGFGDFLAVFAIIAVVTFKLHGTATQVAMVLVSFMAPMAIVSPLAGVFVDRWHLKRTMIASDLIRGVLVLALVFVHDLYVIYPILFMMSVVSAFFVPAQSVTVRTLVPMAGLMAVNGLMSQAQQGSLIVAPSVAGEMVQLVSIRTARRNADGNDLDRRRTAQRGGPTCRRDDISMKLGSSSRVIDLAAKQFDFRNQLLAQRLLHSCHAAYIAPLGLSAIALTLAAGLDDSGASLAMKSMAARELVVTMERIRELAPQNDRRT